MTRLDRAALAATLMLTLVPAIATAEPARVAHTARIVVRDLDLATAAGQQHFRQRAQRAAAMACGTAADIRDRLDVLRCQAEMRSEAQARLAALSHARETELAAVAPR